MGSFQVWGKALWWIEGLGQSQGLPAQSSFCLSRQFTRQTWLAQSFGSANCLLESGAHLTDLAGSGPTSLPSRFPLGGGSSQALEYKVSAEGISGWGEAGGHTCCPGPGQALSSARPCPCCSHRTPSPAPPPLSQCPHLHHKSLGSSSRKASWLPTHACLPLLVPSHTTATLLWSFLGVNKSSFPGLGPVWAQAFPAGTPVSLGTV